MSIASLLLFITIGRLEISSYLCIITVNKRSITIDYFWQIRNTNHHNTRRGNIPSLPKVVNRDRKVTDIDNTMRSDISSLPKVINKNRKVPDSDHMKEK